MMEGENRGRETKCGMWKNGRQRILPTPDKNPGNGLVLGWSQLPDSLHLAIPSIALTRILRICGVDMLPATVD